MVLPCAGPLGMCAGTVSMVCHDGWSKALRLAIQLSGVVQRFPGFAVKWKKTGERQDTHFVITKCSRSPGGELPPKGGNPPLARRGGWGPAVGVLHYFGADSPRSM